MRIMLLLLYPIVVRTVFPYLGTAEAPELTQRLKALSKAECARPRNAPEEHQASWLLQSRTLQ